jgi:hypothetical protein
MRMPRHRSLWRGLAETGVALYLSALLGSAQSHGRSETSGADGGVDSG